MQPSHSNRASANQSKPRGLAVGLPLLLSLMFLAAQVFNFDTAGWSSGFDHPWEGWDHLVTMLAVGIWAAQLRGQAIWMLPLAFVGVMGLGGFAGAEGFSIPHVEGLILLSCAVFGVLITRKVRFSTKVNVLIVAFFAFFHGFAHGHEISTSASLISYVLGFMLATLLLHGAGILVAKLVVLAATCLMTVLFSQAAIARNADNSVELKAKAPAVSLTNVASLGFWGSSNDYLRVDLALAAGLSAGDCIPSGSDGRLLFSSGPGGGNESIEVARSSLSMGYHSVAKGFGNALHLIGCRIQHQATLVWQERVSAVGDFEFSSAWSFKHYFPDINHTPGSDLLSNGVGLTSPPLALFGPVSPQDFPHFRNNSFRGFEKLHPQSSMARFDTGNPFTKTSGEVRQDGSSFYRRNLGHAINIFSLALTCLRNPSNEGTQLRPVFQKFRLSAGNGQSVKLSIKNNNDITRRNNDESI